jgi:hypothetical protein
MDTPSPLHVTDTTATANAGRLVLSENPSTLTITENGKKLTIPTALTLVGLHLRVNGGIGTTLTSARSRLVGQAWKAWTSTSSGLLSPAAFRHGADFELEIADQDGPKPIRGGGFILVEDEGGGGI